MRPPDGGPAAGKRTHIGRPRPPLPGCSGVCDPLHPLGGPRLGPASRPAPAHGPSLRRRRERPAGPSQAPGRPPPRPPPAAARSVNASFNHTSKCLPGSFSPQTQKGSSPESANSDVCFSFPPGAASARGQGLPIRHSPYPPGPRAPRPSGARPAGRRTAGWALGAGGQTPHRPGQRALRPTGRGLCGELT